MSDYATRLAHAAGHGYSGPVARAGIGAGRRLEPEEEETCDEILDAMVRQPALENQDPLIDALRFALVHLAPRHVDRVTEMLRGSA